MTVLKAVKLALFISFLSFPVFGKTAWTIEPKFNCGKYIFRGKLHTNNRGDIIFQVRRNTTSPFELLLLGEHVESLMEKNETNQIIEVDIPKSFTGSNNSYVFFEKFLAQSALPEGEHFKLISNHDCHQ